MLLAPSSQPLLSCHAAASTTAATSHHLLHALLLNRLSFYMKSEPSWTSTLKCMSEYSAVCSNFARQSILSRLSCCPEPTQLDLQQIFYYGGTPYILSHMRGPCHVTSLEREDPLFPFLKLSNMFHTVLNSCSSCRRLLKSRVWNCLPLPWCAVGEPRWLIARAFTVSE